jgi:Rha family phage regulatory protein
MPKKVTSTELVVTNQSVEISDSVLVPEVIKKPKRKNSCKSKKSALNGGSRLTLGQDSDGLNTEGEEKMATSKKSQVTSETVEVVRVFEKRGELLVDSRDVARHFEKRHKDVLESISKLVSVSKSGGRHCRPRDYVDIRGKTQKYYEMTEVGLARLAMGFRGPIAEEWKDRYAETFDAMKRKLLQLSDPARQEAQQKSKVQRRFATDSIQELIAYAAKTKTTSHYVTDPDFPYTLFTNMVQKALFGVSGRGVKIREWATEIELVLLTAAERIVEKGIRAGIQLGVHYKKIYWDVKAKIEEFAANVGCADYQHLLLPKSKPIALSKPRKKKPVFCLDTCEIVL